MYKRQRENCTDLGYCTRDALQVPSGERYELCRSVHAEANAIISASRSSILGGTLYLAGRDAKTGELLADATSCSMCRRLIINAGIQRVVIRRTPTEYAVVHVEDWIRAVSYTHLDVYKRQPPVRSVFVSAPR